MVVIEKKLQVTSFLARVFKSIGYNRLTIIIL